ncbi:clathrin coat assembly protein AP180 isoform X4 [Oreochromis aureus]|uniref:clathrin coat assembly protein AP180 isoform X4 n=1 Tax=Oreochromis aureus TaxID=47969 RepID=UPI0019548444|nr:clathrin coat assembly protein AP180 isoform X4 [Oreochromis aureus]
MSGQTLTDRIAAAQYSLTGSEVCRAVCKATTHEQTAPKKKHLEYLIQATQETNVNVPQMADTLIERAGNASWVVVFKALITTHHLMVHGNERFLQFLASRNTLFNLSNFLDRTGSHGLDMSTFIRRYSRYLNEKAFAYRQMSFDFGRVKKGAEGVMRTMSVEKLLKGMPTLQSQIDALLEFDVHPKDLNNGVINACFLLLFKDLIKLYACYNDGIINLLEKFFQMKRSQCKDGLEIYKRFLTRMTRVSEFFKIAEEVGIDKNDIPELTKAPESLLASLETHLNTLEGKKPSPTKDATANNSMPAAAAAAAPAKPAPPAAVGGPPARPVPPAKPPPPSVTPTAPVPTTASNALDDGFLLDLDPMSSSSAGGTAAASSTTGWGDLLGDGPAAVAAGPAADAFGGSDPFATTEGSADIAPELDLFAMKPADTGADAAAITPPTSSDAPTIITPIAAPTPSSTNTTTTTTTATTTTDTTTESAAAPTLDLFGDMFDSMPEQSPTTESKAATTPSVDLFGADLPAVSRGPSPLPEPAPAGDIVTGESSCFTFTASLFPFLFYEGCSQTSFCMVLGSATSTSKGCTLQGCGYTVKMQGCLLPPSASSSLHVCFSLFRTGRKKTLHEQRSVSLELKQSLINTDLIKIFFLFCPDSFSSPAPTPAAAAPRLLLLFLPQGPHLHLKQSQSLSLTCWTLSGALWRKRRVLLLEGLKTTCWED